MKCYMWNIECNSIKNVQYNVLTLHWISKVEIDRPIFVILKMTNKRFVQPKRIINNVVVIVMGMFINFLILMWCWRKTMLTQWYWASLAHANNYWGIPTNEKVQLENCVKRYKNVNEYNNESKINQSSSSKQIYTYDSSNEKIGL